MGVIFWLFDVYVIPYYMVGYQYGRIPWNEADITCIVDNKSVAKFCLNELCTKVCEVSIIRQACCCFSYQIILSYQNSYFYLFCVPM